MTFTKPTNLVLVFVPTFFLVFFFVPLLTNAKLLYEQKTEDVLYSATSGGDYGNNAQGLGDHLSGTPRYLGVKTTSTSTLLNIHWNINAYYTQAAFESNVAGNFPGGSSYTTTCTTDAHGWCTVDTTLNNGYYGWNGSFDSLASTTYWAFQFEKSGSPNFTFRGSSAKHGSNKLLYTLGPPSDYSQISPGSLRFYIADTGGYAINATTSISTNTTWLKDRVYLVSGVLTIDSGITLTVEPGTTIKFDTTTTSGLAVNGTLNAAGVSTSTIFFTSSKDDLIGGDSNLDATSTTATSGDWAGIVINSGGNAVFSHTIMRYGGSISGSGAMIHNNGGTLQISTSSVGYGSGYGIKNSLGTTSLISTDLGFNTYGLYFAGGSVSILGTTTIHDNSSYGIYNSTISNINAENVNWGAASGPYHTSNSGGTGNTVSDFVDFSPWTGSIHFILSGHRCPSNTCGSVRNNQLLYIASTTFSSELGDAVSLWGNQILIAPATSTPPHVSIDEGYFPDFSWKGAWDGFDQYPTLPDQIFLNSYFLNSQTSTLRKNTIIHELGHALGLDHSYTGNIMYMAQSNQTTFGPQDSIDFNYLWP